MNILESLKNHIGALLAWEGPTLSFQNHSKDEGRGDIPWRGRLCARFSDTVGWCSAVRVSWSLATWTTHCTMDIDPTEAEVGFSLAVPPFALWVHVETKLAQPSLKGLDAREHARRLRPRELRVAFHDAAIWWNVWTDPMEFRSDAPRWRQGSFHIDDLVLGSRCSEESGPLTYPTVIPLPEGQYPATVRLYSARTWRERFPRLTFNSTPMAEIELDAAELERQGRAAPLFPGKGENAWDLDDDTIWKMTTPCWSVAEAVSAYAGAVMQRRERRGGRIDWQPGGGPCEA